MKHILNVLILLLVFSSTKAQVTDTLTNEKLIKLHKAGFSKEVLNLKIQNSVTMFDVSIDGLMNLKKAGIPEDIINVMIAVPVLNSETSNVEKQSNHNFIDPKKATPNSGIYYQNTIGEYEEVEPSVLTSTKSNAAAQLLLSSFINSKMKASLSGKSSSLHIGESSPKFLFVFDTTSKGNLNNENNFWFGNVRSPKEFLLVKLDVVKNSREIVVGKANAVSSNMGIDDKLVLPFTVKKLSNGVYEVNSVNALLEGEYCFMFAQGIKQGQSSKVFDFSIKKQKAF